MALVSAKRLKPLERWSPTLFLLGGPLVLIATVVQGIHWFASVSIPDIAYWPLLPLGFALSLAGLVGLYPRLIEHARWSAAAGLGLGILCLVLLLVGLVVLAATRPAGPYPGNLGPSGPLFFLGSLLGILPIAVYGVAGFITAIPSRTTWGLLVALALIQFVEFLFVLVVFPSHGVSASSYLYRLYLIFGYGISMTVSMVAIGFSLRGDPDRSAERFGATA